MQLARKRSGGSGDPVACRRHVPCSGKPSKQTPEDTAEAEEKADIAVVPLAVLLLAGPGAISTVIIFSHQASNWMNVGLLIAIIALVALIAKYASRPKMET